MVSCVLPVYRARETLSRCLDSLLASVDVEFEILLVLNGGDDGSGAIAEEYAAKDPRIRVLHSKPGAYAARNVGMDAARGEYLCFCDSDDTVEPEWMARLAGLLDETGAQMAVCGYHKLTLDAQGKTVKKREVFRHLREGVISGREYLLELDSPYSDGFGNPATLWLRMVRMSVIRENGLRMNEDYLSAEDFDFVMKLLPFCERVALTPEPLYRYWMRECGSLVSRYHPVILDTYADIIAGALRVAAPPRSEEEVRIVLGTLASLSIGGMVRLCRWDATIPEKEIKGRLKRFIRKEWLPELYAAYRPKPGQSADIPELALLGDVEELFRVCREKSEGKFGRLAGRQ